MGIKFKKISKSENACVYALAEEISSKEYAWVRNWLDIHCPDDYLLDNQHLFIRNNAEVFFDLTFPYN